MLHHISVAVNNPARVSEVLAEIFQGKAYPFPPCPGGYIVLAGDEYGTAIELAPSGVELIPGMIEVEFAQVQAPVQYISVHAALSVPVSQRTIEEIAIREGWLARLCDRGPFKVLELWVENKFLVELLPPNLVKTYLNFMTIDNFKMLLEQPVPEAVAH